MSSLYLIALLLTKGVHKAVAQASASYGTRCVTIQCIIKDEEDAPGCFMPVLGVTACCSCRERTCILARSLNGPRPRAAYG